MKSKCMRRLRASWGVNHGKSLALFIGLLSCSVFAGKAQVLIGDVSEPNVHAVLELKQPTSKKLGFLPPQLSLSAFNDELNAISTNPLPDGLVVLNNSTNQTEPNKGIYIWTGDQWQSLTNNWFYMPPTVFDTDDSDPALVKTKDLWLAYSEQFKTTQDAKYKSSGAPDIIKKIPPQSNATDFYYYVTAFDTNVFDIQEITTDGKMKYKVKAAASDSTYINIIFVRKQY